MIHKSQNHSPEYAVFLPKFLMVFVLLPTKTTSQEPLHYEILHKVEPTHNFMPPLPNNQVDRSLRFSKREKCNKQRGEECKSPKKTEQSMLTNFSAYRPNVRRLAFFFFTELWSQRRILARARQSLDPVFWKTCLAKASSIVERRNVLRLLCSSDRECAAATLS